MIIILLGLAAWLKSLQVSAFSIRLTLVFSFVLAFELLKKGLQNPIEYITNDNPIIQFVVDLILGGLLGALHRLVEIKMLKRLDINENSSVNLPPFMQRCIDFFKRNGETRQVTEAGESPN